MVHPGEPLRRSRRRGNLMDAKYIRLCRQVDRLVNSGYIFTVLFQQSILILCILTKKA